MYFIKTPGWLRKIFRAYTWRIATREKVLYLSFDDGPHPVATPFVLKELNRYGAKATFFCIGKNVTGYPGIYKDILIQGHTTGNHTNDHLNGWNTGTKIYIDNVQQASGYIQSSFFRPPYGRITKKQGKLLITQGFKIIMWEVLSGDFDTTLKPEKCLQNVLKKSVSGSIIVFHDSEKAYPNLQYTLPKVLEYFIKKGYRFESLNQAFAQNIKLNKGPG